MNYLEKKTLNEILEMSVANARFRHKQGICPDCLAILKCDDNDSKHFTCHKLGIAWTTGYSRDFIDGWWEGIRECARALTPDK